MVKTVLSVDTFSILLVFNPKMKIVEDYRELVGKTIAFSHMAQFAEHITIATEDKCVLVVTQEEDDVEEKKTTVLTKKKAVKYIDNHECLREELGKLGIFDNDAFKKRQEEAERQQKAAHRIQREKEEWEQYMRLKEKFEPESI